MNEFHKIFQVEELAFPDIKFKRDYWNIYQYWYKKKTGKFLKKIMYFKSFFPIKMNSPSMANITRI